MRRLRRNNKFWWFVSVSFLFFILVVASFGIMFWQQLSAVDKEFAIRLILQQIIYIFSAAVILFAGLGFAIDWIFRLYVLPIDKIADETAIIHSVNPAHRIRIDGSQDIERLTRVINEGADQFEELRDTLEERTLQARAKTEEEKNILALVMAELPEGVLVCNREGQVILYNQRARLLLAGHGGENSHPADQPSGGYIGLGRSVFGILDKNAIIHALDEIGDKLRREEPDVASYFVMVGRDNRLLSFETLPLLDQREKFTGFILIVTDVTRQLESDSRVDFLFQALTKSARASLASVRAAIEVILAYPNIDQDQLDQFHKIIHHETLTIGKLVDKTAADYAGLIRSRWPLARMLVSDLLKNVEKKAAEKLGIQIQVRACDADNWVRVESYSMAMALLFLLDKTKRETRCDQFDFSVDRQKNFVYLDFIWPGSPIRIETLYKWEDQQISIAEEGLPHTLREILKRHAAEIWSHSCDNKAESYLRLLLPTVDLSVPRRLRGPTILPPSRPEFFDFDLFNQPGQTPELDDRPLTELSYTVFDTETTGLNPKGGDEIIAIGALRIVNGRLLLSECFDRLVNPQRPVPWDSTQIHGIQPEMLADQPTIERIMPLFHEFAEDTTLVAHNAAFDMRMLQIKEALTGIRFVNPVLDTMLLSAVVHPAEENHNLEAIAERLGVNIIGRHTALGDAIATGEIFLKLMPLLSNRGIQTLRQARIASQKTYYARIQY